MYMISISRFRLSAVPIHMLLGLSACASADVASQDRIDSGGWIGNTALAGLGNDSPCLPVS